MAEHDSGLLYAPQSSSLQSEVTAAWREAKIIFDRRAKDLQALLESQWHKLDSRQFAPASARVGRAG